MSFNIGGLFDVAATAIGGMFGGPIGAMLAQIAKQVISSVVDQVISQLPTDQTTKDLLSTAFHAGMGDTAGAAQSAQNLVKDLTESTNASPADSAEAQRSVDDMQDAMRNLLTQMVQQNSDSQDNGNDAPVQSGGGAAAKGGAGGKGWLWAIAEALGKQCNQLADEMQSKADSLDAKDPKSVAEFQTITQQFSLLMNTTTNAIKTLGEAMGNTARKN